MAGFFPNPPTPGLDPNADHAYQLIASSYSMVTLSFIALIAYRALCITMADQRPITFG